MQELTRKKGGPERRTDAKRADARNERRWQAVLAKDKSADGAFYTCVATTGIYCRPSCPARTPNRSNVSFRDTPAAAKAAGFRPCKRCKPDDAPLQEIYGAKVAAACRLIETAEEAPSLAQLARQAELSPYHFHRIFKSIAGVTPKAYAMAHRQKRIRARLTRSKTVTEAIHDSGFNSSGRFYADAKDVLGMTPTAFRAGGSDADIRFAVGECSLGSILVAASHKGVCAIFIGDDPNELTRTLQDQFPRANLIGADPAFEQLTAQVVGFVEAPETGWRLPLDMRGTAFQHRVWQALRQIPIGETLSYAEVAERIGAPKAVRAVGSACARNKIAVAIPCHRVVRTDGDLSGYRWSVERKRALLDREAKAAAANRSKARR